jgi:tetratricopeptide (TPR) repeat protein/peroxiredoxin
VSRGPAALVDQAEGEDYADAFRAANRMANEGKSWSGNEPNCCFLNTGKLRFADVSATSGLDYLDDGRAIAAVDWDEDGDLDLLQLSRTAPQLRFLRNDWQGSPHWLSLQLQGVRCNRDAIGARVLITRKGVEGVDARTLYAGSSFLSQSSKWVHFGLGDNAQIQQLVVIWPGGVREEFTGVKADGRYRLKQGTGAAEPVSRRREPISFAAAPAPVKEPTEHARVVVGTRVPFPPLTYEDFAEQPQRLTFERPTLIQLWVSWCPMCQGELHEFTARAAEIQQTGLRVLALSVDGLGTDQSSPEAAVEAMARLGFPFESGRATETVLRKLELLRGELYANVTPFPVPTSLLIDGQGRLIIVYLGPLSVDQLLRDLPELSASDERLRQLGEAFSGRWFTPPKPVLLAPLAQAFDAEGFAQDAQYYRALAEPQAALSMCAIALDLEREGELQAAAAQYRRALQLESQSVQVLNLAGKFWLRRGRLPDAGRLFSKAIELDPHSAEAHYNLGTVNLMERDPFAATAAYREAVRLDPNLADAHLALGRLLLEQANWVESERHLRRALDVNPQLAPALVYLSAILARQSEPRKAIESLEQALKIQPNLVDAHTALGDLLAAQGDLSTAVIHYAQAVKTDPRSRDATLKLAWYLATIPNQHPPDAPLRLVRRLVSPDRERSAQALDVLAAAQAHAGEFDDAIKTARRAIELAAPDTSLAREIEARLKHYQAKQPYRLPNVRSAAENPE